MSCNWLKLSRGLTSIHAPSVDRRYAPLPTSRSSSISTTPPPASRRDDERGRPIHWSADGHLVLTGEEQFPKRLYRRHVITGKIEPWRTISPPDPSGVMFVGRVFIAADDDQFYVYSYSRGLNDLFLVRNVR